MSRVYARGRRAWGYCARSGKRVLLRDMVIDGQTGLQVARDEYDPKHPQETPVIVDDPVALYRPAPDLDAPGQVDQGNLWPGNQFGGEPYFGGGGGS